MTACDVHALRIDVAIAQELGDRHGEGFHELDAIDIAQLHAGLLEHAIHRADPREQRRVRIAAALGVTRRCERAGDASQSLLPTSASEAPSQIGGACAIV